MVDRERPEHAHVVVEREPARHDVLRQLVGREGCDRDRGEADPLRQAGRERALRDGDGREGVGRGADAHVGHARSGLAQPRSSLRRQSMHSVAHGSASSRSSGMSPSQVRQRPKLPSAIRLSAPSISVRTCSEFSSSV